MSDSSVEAPFGDLALSFSDSELREIAYEIFLGACRSSSEKPLAQTPQQDSDSGVVWLKRSLTGMAARKVKKVLGLKSSSGKRRSGGGSVSQRRVRRTGSVGEMMRLQMKVSEQTDSRLRKALLRIAASQIGKGIESMVLPLELLQQLKPSDFPTEQDYEAWQRRNLKLLEVGLLLHPHFPPLNTDTCPKQLQQIINAAAERPLEAVRDTEPMQLLRSVVMSLACRSLDGSVSEICHWADGSPLNLRLYQMLLEASFDVSPETFATEEADEVLELIKKTWVTLGMNQVVHHLCSLWVLFRRYVSGGRVENALLSVVNDVLSQVGKDVMTAKDPAYFKILNSILKSIFAWTEKRLLTYYHFFSIKTVKVMGNVLCLNVLAATVMVGDIDDEHHRKRIEANVAFERVETYIISSLRTVFAQVNEKVKYSSSSSEKQQNQLPHMLILAQEVRILAVTEKAIFSPVLKKWHPLAAGVAAATLHSCYRTELKKFISGITELTPDAAQVLRAAEKLEKDLVQIAIEGAVDSEDGWKSIIREMPSYEAEALIADLVRSWVETRVDRLQEWIDRSIQAEVWDPQANKEHLAPSAVEVLRMVDETLEAFFLLPISNHHLLLPDLMTGIDRCVQHYTLKVKSGCGTRSSFMPSMPALTRCSAWSKYSLFRRTEKSKVAKRRKSKVGRHNGNEFPPIPQLFCRINTLQHIQTELEVSAARIKGYLRNSGSTNVDEITNLQCKVFELSVASSVEGVRELSEATAYRIVFCDLSHALLDSLYVGEVSSSRLECFLQELEHYLEVISSTIHDRVRTLVITDIMKASFEGFLFVLLAGGPCRTFIRQDYDILEEDFRFLMDLFWSNGDGLQDALIQKYSATARSVLLLFGTDSETLTECFKSKTLETYGSWERSKLPLPETCLEWNAKEPDTLLRVLCYRRDEAAAKFLETYNLPRKYSAPFAKNGYRWRDLFSCETGFGCFS